MKTKFLADGIDLMNSVTLLRGGILQEYGAHAKSRFGSLYWSANSADESELFV